jgi:mRNA-degrading endonuclease RelE of RelBE toxin-antitoxin system
MAWTIKIEKAAKGDLSRLDTQIAHRILNFLHQNFLYGRKPLP